MTPEYRIKTEKQIKEYLDSSEIVNIKNMQVEQTFNDLGVEVHVWNIKTEKDFWWVVEGEGAPMNLYPQGAFYFSADEAYSFHMGITQRVHASSQESFKHVLDEIPLDIDKLKSINRRLNAAATGLFQMKTTEEIQSIGLTCRESLIVLGNILTERTPSIIKKNGLKSSDFKGIAKIIIDLYASGSSNASLRKYARNMSEMSWSYSSEIVHSQHRNLPDAKICLLMTCSVVSIFENLYLKYLGFDSEPICEQCNGRDHDILVNKDQSSFIFHCNECDYENEIDVVEPVED